MNRALVWMISVTIGLIGLSLWIGFALAFDLVFLLGGISGGILSYQWLAERKRLRRRHQAEGMSGWEVRLPYGETDSDEKMARLLGYSTKFDSFVLAYVGSDVEERNDSSVVVEFRFVIDPNQARAAREKILQEYPDAFVTEVEDQASEILIARYLELNPYLPVSEIIRQKWASMRARRLQASASA
jgi:hypothetical protein